MKAKHICIFLAVLFITLSTIGCTQEVPTQVEMNLHAVYADKDGGVIEELGTVAVVVTKTQYTEKEERLHISLDLPDMDFRISQYESGSLIHDYSNLELKDDYTITNVPCYRNTDGKFGMGWIGYDEEAGLFIMADPFRDGCFIVGSVSGEYEASEILDYFPIILELA